VEEKIAEAAEKNAADVAAATAKAAEEATAAEVAKD